MVDVRADSQASGASNYSPEPMSESGSCPGRRSVLAALAIDGRVDDTASTL